MAKIGLTKLGLKKNTNLIELPWNDQVIEIKEYLPIEDKLGVIERIVNQSLDDNNFANPARIIINTVLEITFAYTNINFTDKQKEDKQNLYDLLVSSGLWSEINKKLCEMNEFDFIDNGVRQVIDEIYRYKNSALGILDAIQEDYQKLDLDAEKIVKDLSNPEELALLKKVVSELG